MPSCVVKWCKNNTTRHKKNQGITFHRFPSANLPWKKDWIDVIRECRGEANWTPTKSSVVCSIHFDANDLYVTETGRLRVVNFGMPKKITYGTEDVTSNLEQSYKESCPSSASTSFPQISPVTEQVNSHLETAAVIDNVVSDSDQSGSTSTTLPQNSEVGGTGANLEQPLSVPYTPRKRRLMESLIKKEKQLQKQTKKIKILNQKVRRLQDRNKSLKNILQALKKRKLR